MGAPQIITFGCRLNTYESEVMRSHAEAQGLEDAVIFNTCAVTSEAQRQARQAIRRARRDNPNSRIIVTGCAAQIDPGSFAVMDDVVGRFSKERPERFGIPGFGPDHQLVVSGAGHGVQHGSGLASKVAPLGGTVADGHEHAAVDQHRHDRMNAR